LVTNQIFSLYLQLDKLKAPRGKTMAIARLTRKQKKERKFAAVKKYALSEKLVDSIEECNKLNQALKKQIKGTNFEYEYELQKASRNR